MGKVIQAFAAIGCLFFAFSAQGQERDARLVEFYGQAYVDRLEQTSPATLDFLDFWVRNGYVILEEVPREKWENLPDISTITLLRADHPTLTEADLENLNILQLDIQRSEYQAGLYRIGTTGKVLALPSYRDLMLRFQNEQPR